MAFKKIYTDKGTYENIYKQPETKFMAVAFLANMAMAVAPVIKDTLDSCYISLQQLLLKFMAVAGPRLTTSMSAFFILNNRNPQQKLKDLCRLHRLSYKRIF